MDSYRSLIKPLLFTLPPNISHDLAVWTIRNFPYLFSTESKEINSTHFGITFKNPIGLAAGFDKNGILINQMHHLGFSHMEVGTITPKPQEGNPKPNLFRYEENQSLLNYMGFNNDGLYTIAKRLERKNNTIIIGANIGKNKSTNNKIAYKDYIESILTLNDLVDYFTINISSPNTPDLRDLLGKENLSRLLEEIKNHHTKLNNAKPLLVKISPDVNNMEEIVDKFHYYKISGIVSTNTTQNHTFIRGGLSGKPLTELATYVTKELRQMTTLPIISSGGIMTTDDAKTRLESSDLVQLYTGLIYNGPNLTKEIIESL
jgi:dihydroorotate dehydrogenase